MKDDKPQTIQVVKTMKQHIGYKTLLKKNTQLSKHALTIAWPPSRQCEIPWRFAALGMLSVTHIMPVLVLNTCMDANMQLTINSFRQLFPDKFFSLTFACLLVKSLTFLWQLSNSMTVPCFPDKWSPCDQVHLPWLRYRIRQFIHPWSTQAHRSR